MPKEYSLSKYKMAIHVTEDFPIILNEILTLQNSLKKYRRYAPVESMWENLEENKEILQQNLIKYTKILNKKGAIHE